MSGAAGLISFAAALLTLGTDVPRWYFLPIGLFVYVTVLSDQTSLQKIRTHTHDSDGKAQFNGIRGWY